MDTRGILQPGALGRAFTLERRTPPDDLSDLLESYWIVAWDLTGRDPYRSEVMPHPAVHLTIEPDGALVYGVRRRRDVRVLSGTGWVVGTKFKPGGFARLIDRPVWELTDTVRPPADVFGSAGRALQRAADRADSVQAKLDVVQSFLRARRPTDEDPAASLVAQIVAEMRDRAPGPGVGDYARRHHVSTRTLQRMFRHYVGVGPKWVLQRYRLHEAIEQLPDRASADLTRFALDLGYYDQAHFARDFRAVVGRSPSAYEGQARAAGQWSQ